MVLTLKPAESLDLRPRITVFGVGGAGGNAVNNMIAKALEGAEFVVANTDAQALQQSRSTRKLQLGSGVTQGLGAGAKPQVGAQAAEESLEAIVDNLAGSHMCFITAGMGGGTGTGAAPVIARAAREMGILTVGVVTKPFQFEGSTRMRLAEGGIEQLQQVVDTLIIIPNQNLFRIANERTTFAEAFMMADDVLYQGVKGVTDLMVRPGLINLDFADVRAVMDEMGKAMMGTGEAAGETRAIDAAEKAIANPLLDEVSLKGAKGVLINITGGYDLTLFELDEAANRIRAEVDPDANIIVGSTLDPEMKDVMRVSVVATGIDAAVARAETPAAPARVEPARPEPVRQVAPARPVVGVTRVAAPVAAAAPAPVAAPAAQSANLFAAPEQGGFADDGMFDLDDGSLARPAARDAEPARDNPFVAAERGDAAAPRAPAVVRPVPVAAPAAREDDRAPRFGFNNLIHRMTGAAAAKEKESPFTSAALRKEPAATPAPRAAAPAPAPAEPRDDEDMRMEIPAFLRRQAN
jgi:cell division protein FtsZ